MSSVEPIRRVCIAELVLGRPRLLTHSGSLSEILALFDGYNLATTHAHTSIEDQSPVAVLNWLRKNVKSRLGKFPGPIQYYEAILDHFGSEAQALERMREFATTLTDEMFSQGKFS